MAAAAEKNLPPPQSDDPFAWEPDPVVVVSRRPRVLYFPPALLEREPTAADLALWSSDRWQASQCKQLAIGAGVTFLGCFTSSWAYRETQHGHAPKGPPRPDQMLLVQPYTNAHALLTHQSSGNIDPETRRLRPDRVRAALTRVVDYHRKHASPHLFSAPDGFDAPEVVTVRLSEVFSQRTDAGQHAHSIVLNAIPHLRANPHEVVTPLGALHDYALRSPGSSGRAIVDAARQWAARKKIG